MFIDATGIAYSNCAAAPQTPRRRRAAQPVSRAGRGANPGCRGLRPERALVQRNRHGYCAGGGRQLPAAAATGSLRTTRHSLTAAGAPGAPLAAQLRSSESLETGLRIGVGRCGCKRERAGCSHYSGVDDRASDPCPAARYACLIRTIERCCALRRHVNRASQQLTSWQSCFFSHIIILSRTVLCCQNLLLFEIEHY